MLYLELSRAGGSTYRARSVFDDRTICLFVRKIEKANRGDRPTSACLRQGDAQGSSVAGRISEDVIVEMILSTHDDQRSERHGERGPHKCAGVSMGIGRWVEFG